MPCSAKLSVTLQTEILSIEDFLKQIIFLKLFNSVFCVYDETLVKWYLLLMETGESHLEGGQKLKLADLLPLRVT